MYMLKDQLESRCIWGKEKTGAVDELEGARVWIM
jgi:hypothetical protein